MIVKILTYSHKFDQVSNNCKVASGQARQLDLVSNPRFLGMANHLRPFSGALDLSEGQEWGGGDIGGQGRFQGVKLYLGFRTC